jgi:NADPH:quinone reductase
MKVVAFVGEPGEAGGPGPFVDLERPDPVPERPRDLLVRVHAVSVNPRDLKSRVAFPASPEEPRVFGYDASGVVEAVGPEATLFRPGEPVFYAGVLDRPGSNAGLQLVDERIVGRKPRTLDHTTAAALPLITLTAYEMLFDRLGLRPGQGAGEALMILGGAGGVPSMAIQLARALTGLTVIASASRPDSEAHVRALGAHHVVDHSRPLKPQIEALALETPLTTVFSTHTSPEAWADLAACLAPQGRFGLIDDPPPLDLRAMKMKSISIHWEAMFTRPMFGTPDMVRQHEILDEVATLIDAGRLKPVATRDAGPLNAANLAAAHAALAGGHVVGKIVLGGITHG